MSAAGLITREALALGAEDSCLSATRALCDQCGRLTDAKIVLRGAQVLLVKWCPSHGVSEALVSSDRDWYLRSLSYVKPGTVPRARSVETHTTCPESCGLCPEHQQHTCVPILEITGACELNCPICLVANNKPKHLSLEQVDAILDRLVACEGKLNMLTLSGGEPTRHPKFLAIVDRCLRPEIGLVSVSTNGLSLAADDDLIRALRDRGVVISLQMDGFRPECSLRLRGRADLGDVKRRLIDRALALGARLSFTFTLAGGLNEDELPAVLDLLFREDQVLSVMVQPLARMTAEMRAAFPPITIPDAVRLLAGASGGVLKESDFTPLPCSHPSCFALTYLLKAADGSLVSLPSLVEADDYLDIIKNQALLCTDPDSVLRIKDALYKIWSSDGVIPRKDDLLRTLKQLMLDLNRVGGGGAHRDMLELGTRNVKSIFIHQFMDPSTFDLSRAAKCCNHYPQADGRLLPACVRNNVRLGAGR